MDIQILPLQAPYEYIFCNGEVGQHIATLVVSEITKYDEYKFELTTHSYPVVKYWNAPRGVVWDKAELASCVVLCNDSDKRVDIDTFNMVSNQWYCQEHNQDQDMDYFDPDSHFGQCELLKEKLRHYGIGFKTDDGSGEVIAGLEIGSCSEGYFLQSFDVYAFDAHYTEATIEKLIARLLEEREMWEELYDHAVKIRFEPESSLARELNVESL